MASPAPCLRQRLTRQLRRVTEGLCENVWQRASVTRQCWCAPLVVSSSSPLRLFCRHVSFHARHVSHSRQAQLWLQTRESSHVGCGSAPQQQKREPTGRCAPLLPLHRRTPERPLVPVFANNTACARAPLLGGLGVTVACPLYSILVRKC